MARRSACSSAGPDRFLLQPLRRPAPARRQSCRSRSTRSPGPRAKLTSNPLKQPVQRHSRPAQKQRRRKIDVYKSRYFDRQLQGAVSAGEVIDYSREQRPKQTPPDVRPPVAASGRIGANPDQRNRFPTERAAVQIDTHRLATKRTALLVHKKPSLARSLLGLKCANVRL